MYVYVFINCVVCLLEIDFFFNVELVSGEWRVYFFNVNRIILIIVIFDDSVSDMYFNRLLEFVFNIMVGIKIF